MIYGLPQSVEIGGVEYEINSDFRCILDILEVLNDKDLSDRERAFFALGYFYPDMEKFAQDDYKEASEKLFWFINGGTEDKTKQKNQKKIMDWEQDFPYIIAPINKAFGKDVRSMEYLHWWTFLGAYMEIGECVFSQIVSIRDKQARGKKLEKYEQEWFSRNKELVLLKSNYRYTNEDFEFFNMIK